MQISRTIGVIIGLLAASLAVWFHSPLFNGFIMIIYALGISLAVGLHGYDLINGLIFTTVAQLVVSTAFTSGGALLAIATAGIYEAKKPSLLIAYIVCIWAIGISLISSKLSGAFNVAASIGLSLLAMSFMCITSRHHIRNG